MKNAPDITTTKQSEDWKTYRNTTTGYEVKYPTNWQIETTAEGSVRIINPARKGKDDTDQPTEAVMIQVKQDTLPCEGSNWKVGFGLVNHKTACLNSKVFMTMVAFDEQGKNIEEQILSTFAFTDSKPTPFIASVTPSSGPIGTIVEIRGNNLSGFEGDLDVIFERSDGKKIMLTDTFGDYPKTGGSLIKVIAKEPCQQGETIYDRYSGIPTQCNYIAMTPGTYKVYAEPWGKKSNVVNFTITQRTNTIIKNEWGISFSKPSNWDITNNANGVVELKQVSGQWVGDTISISYITGANITTTDAKFGNVTYYWDESGQKWMKIGQNNRTGENESPIPATTYTEYPYVANTFPVFVGTNRWLTLIVPLSHTTFLKLHITGSGQTQPLKDILGTIKKI